MYGPPNVISFETHQVEIANKTTVLFKAVLKTSQTIPVIILSILNPPLVKKR